MNDEVWNLKGYEIRALIRFFMYTMEQDQRGRLMREFPQIYNKVCRRDIVEVSIIGS